MGKDGMRPKFCIRTGNNMEAENGFRQLAASGKGMEDPHQQREEAERGQQVSVELHPQARDQSATQDNQACKAYLLPVQGPRAHP